MNLLAWVQTHPRNPHPWHHPILAGVERDLEAPLLPIGQEPEGRPADALAALLAVLESLKYSLTSVCHALIVSGEGL